MQKKDFADGDWGADDYQLGRRRAEFETAALLWPY